MRRRINEDCGEAVARAPGDRRRPGTPVPESAWQKGIRREGSGRADGGGRLDENVEFLKRKAREHAEWFSRSLPMIASENVMSPLARSFMFSDLADRYAEGRPRKRYYQGVKFIDDIEERVEQLAREVFRCRLANVQPISGTVANLAACFALGKPGDGLAAVDVKEGAHISSAQFGAVGLRGLRNIMIPFDRDNAHVDAESAAKVIRVEKPKILLLGMSVFPFPAPVKELAPVAKEVGARVWYDGAHVLGLIGGRRFQDPLREGADVMTGSTHKTLPGPQRGVLLSDSDEEKFQKRLHKSVFPGVVSNHHIHTMAALGVTLAEHKAFGEAYADQVIRNAQRLAAKLHELGLKVLYEHLGFTKSHTAIVDVRSNGGGSWAAQALEDAGMISNKNFLPDDEGSSQEPGGVRFGSQELTRLGMKEPEMDEVAGFVARVVANKEEPAKVKRDVEAFRAGFQKVHYCFSPDARPHIFEDVL
jgi:glycine hydroxymethyltransferase